MLKQATNTKARQPFLFPVSPHGLVVSPGVKERGAVFTRCETVEFILDLAGYTSDKPLHLSRLLEPSFGNGDFLLVVVERLLTAYGKHHVEDSDILDGLADAIRAVEVDHAACKKTSEKLKQLLTKSGVSPGETVARLKFRTNCMIACLTPRCTQ